MTLKKKLMFFSGGILLFALALFLWGYHLYNKPHLGAGAEKASVQISADALYNKYAADESAADSLYLGKVIEVQGTLLEIQREGAFEVWILSSEQRGGGINCRMFSKTLHRPVKGSNVKIKGRCSGFLADVNLVDCVAE